MLQQPAEGQLLGHGGQHGDQKDGRRPAQQIDDVFHDRHGRGEQRGHADHRRGVLGRGVDERLPKDLGVDFAYTFDRGEVGEITYETFSADFASVTVTGVDWLIGTLDGSMV